MKRFAYSLVLVLFLVVVLVGCGGTTTTTTTATTTTTTMSTTTTPPTTTVVQSSTTTSLPAKTTTSTIPLPTPTVAGTIAFTRGVKDDDNADDIWVVNTDGTGLKMLAGGPGEQSSPRWSPDGNKIVYHDTASGSLEVCVMNADGSGKVQLTKDSVRSCLPDWSPDGTQIVFSYMVSDTLNEEEDYMDICVMNADGSGFRGLTSRASDGSADYWPMWATDGKIYLYRLYNDKPAAEFSVNPDGSGLTQMMELPSEKGGPIYLGSTNQFMKYGISPDGKMVTLHERWPIGVAGLSNHDLDIDRLAIHAANGEGAVVTLLDPVSDYTEDTTVDVAWSPDGKALAIAGLFDQTEWVTRLMIVNADGSGLSAVPGVDAARDPDWRPE